MVQILPKIGLGERLGSALGTGLASGITGLAEHKLGEMQRQKGIAQTQSGLQALGLPQEIATLPENLQGQVLKQILAAPQQQAFASTLANILGGETPAAIGGQPNLQGLTERQASELAKIGIQQKQFQTKEARIQQHHIDKETKPYYDETLKAYKAAKNTNPVLARMQTLLNKGNLPNPVFYSLANKVGGVFGLNVGSLQNADAQEFDKLTNEFLKNAKDIFGSRLTNYDVQTFLKGIPTLSQSDEGKQRIINNLHTLNQGALIKQKAQSDIIAQNGGKRPANLAELVEERVEPELDQLAEQFAQGTPLGKPVRQAEDVLANREVGATENINNQQLGKYSGAQIAPIPTNPLSEAARHLGRTGARAAESILGIPGDIASLGLSGANLLTGGNIPGAAEAQKYIPTSTNLRQITQGLTGQTLEPKNEIERIGDELVSDFAAFALPIKGKIPLKSAAVKSILGNAAGFLGEKIGGPIGKGLAKVGTVLGLSFGGTRNVLNNAMQQSYANADTFAGVAKEGAKELSKDVKSLTKDLTSGIKTTGKTFTADAISGLGDLIKNGKITVKDAWNSKKHINELLRDPNTPDTAKKYLGRVGDSLSKILSSYGKINADFGKAFNKAEDIYRGLNKASNIAQTIQKSVKPETLTSNLIKQVLTFAALKNPAAIPLAGAGLGIGLGVQQLTKFTQLLKNSKEARKYYKNILIAATKDNASLLNRNAHKLDKLANEEGY